MGQSGSGAAARGRYSDVLHGLSESSDNSSSDDSASSTRKWLEVGSEQTEQRWRLPDDANLEFVEAHIKAAMRSGEAYAVEVLCDAATLRRTIVLNGRAMPLVVLFEGRVE
jgi:hypothetical protein